MYSPPPPPNTKKLSQSVISLWKILYFILPCARCCIKTPVTATSTYSDLCLSLLIYFSKHHGSKNNHLYLKLCCAFHQDSLAQAGHTLPRKRNLHSKTLLILLSVPPAPFPCVFSVPLCAPCPFISTPLGLGFFSSHPF